MTDRYLPPPDPQLERLLREQPVTPLTEAQRAEHRAALRAAMARDAAAPGGVPAPSVPSARSVPLAEGLPPTRTVPAARPKPPARRRWSRGWVVPLAAALVLTTGTAATGFFTRSGPADTTLVRCFSTAEPPFTSGTPGTVEVGYGSGAGSVDESAAKAVELCSLAWQEGTLVVPASIAEGASAGPVPVPPMQACVLPDGFVGVFPGDPTVCLQLGLASSTA